MFISALDKFTTLDYPNHLACIIFTGGCNLRCSYCHNAEMVLPELVKKIENPIPFQTVLNFLESRVGMLDGVVICGGEPTVQLDLADRIAEIKVRGFKVKLDTNGTNPQVLQKLIKRNLLDYIAMDLKDSLPYRKQLVGTDISKETVEKSIEIIMKSGLEYEFRSTILPAFHNLETMKKMGNSIKGAKKWAIQRFRSGKTLNEMFAGLEEFEGDEMEFIKNQLAEYAEMIEVR